MEVHACDRSTPRLGRPPHLPISTVFPDRKRHFQVHRLLHGVPDLPYPSIARHQKKNAGGDRQMRLLVGFIRLVGGLNWIVGQTLSWLALGVVVVCFTVVVQRYFFHTSTLWMQDLYVWLAGAMFTGVAGFALLRNDHVRVDIFYRPWPVRRKAMADLFGVVFFIVGCRRLLGPRQGLARAGGTPTMKRFFIQAKNYLSQPENGAGLLYVALCFGILRAWSLNLAEATARGIALQDAVMEMIATSGPRGMFFLWTLVSFALGAWLAFLLLRRTLNQHAMRRVLLVAVVHAIGAMRFYDWGLLLLSILPLFAIVPALLLPRNPSAR
jgi:hypothetical protein